MTFVRPRARILELSSTSGNGPYALAGAADLSYNRFSSFMAIGDTTYGTVVEPGVAFWTGIITYSAANQITLTTVEETKGTFGAGTKEIMSDALASTATFREDIAGAIVTGGTSTGYTVASYRQYDSLSRLNGNIIAFTPHVTNGQTVTLNVDGLGAKPLRFAPGLELGASTLIIGTPYMALYDHGSQAFYLHAGGNAYGVPLAAGMDYWGATTPSSAFAFPIGQAISRTTYAALFALIGTTYGVGDGSTTFNLPDKRGRVSAGFDNGDITGRLNGAFGVNAAALGSAGGEQGHTLTLGETAAGITSSGSNAISVTSSANVTQNAIYISYVNAAGGGTIVLNALPTNAALTSTGTNSISVTSNNTGGGAHNNVQPTIICNYIMRVL